MARCARLAPKHGPPKASHKCHLIRTLPPEREWATGALVPPAGTFADLAQPRSAYSGSRKKHGLKGRPSPSQREVPNDVADRVFGYDNGCAHWYCPRGHAQVGQQQRAHLVSCQHGRERQNRPIWRRARIRGTLEPDARNRRDPGRNRKSTAGRDQRCCPDLGAAASEVVTSGQLVCSLVLAPGPAADPAPPGHRQARLPGPGPHGGAIDPRRAHWISASASAAAVDASAGCGERRECLGEPGTVRLPEVDFAAHAVQAEGGGLGPLLAVEIVGDHHGDLPDHDANCRKRLSRVQRDTPLRDAAPQVVPIPRLPGTLPPCRCAAQRRASRCVTGVEPRRPSTRFDLRGSGGGLACWAAPGRSLCSADDAGDLGAGGTT